MDDKIISLWCFNFFKYFDSTSSAAIIVLAENLESLSSLISQQEVGILASFPDTSAARLE